MNTTNTKKKVSFLSIALGSLVVTSLSTGSAEASWGTPRCKTQCAKILVGNNEKKVNDCATNCKNIDIMDTLRPNAEKLNEANKKHFLDALKYQQSIQEKEHTKIEGLLKTEMGKKKPSQSKINELNKKQDKLIGDINNLGTEIETMEKASKAPERPTSGAPSSLSEKEKALLAHIEAEEAKQQQGGPHLQPDISKPPTHLPPPLPSHLAPQHPTDEKPIDISKPPSDTPPTIEEVHGHQALSKNAEKNPEAEIKKAGGSVPTPPKFGENPREILKADIQAQNPEKKPHEINTLVKQHLDTQYPGKPAGEINQALKEHYEGKHPGKTHAEILEAVKAGGGQLPSGNPTVPPSKAMDEPSPQAPQKTPSGDKPQGNMMDALSSLGDNPMVRLKKVDPEAEAKRREAAAEKLKNSGKGDQSGGMMNDLQNAMAKRRSALEEKTKISAADKAKLDELLHTEKKTPQEIEGMMNEDWELFEDHDAVGIELAKLKK